MAAVNRVLRNCPFCRHDGTLLYNNAMAAVGPFDLSYEVMTCSRCRSVFSDKLAPRADYDQYYATMSKYDQAPVAADSDSGRCHRSLASLIKQVASPRSRILDIGCGTGHLLFCLKEAGFKHLSGLDPSPRSAASAKEHFGLDNIHTGFIDTVADTPCLDGCDVCCLTGVLEHLHAPLEQLEPVVGRLKPGARLVVGVPDLDAFTAEGREPFGELSLEHINFFSRRSLKAFFAGLGCRLETCVTHPGRYESNLLAIAVKDGQATESGRTDDVTVMRAYLEDSRAVLSPRLAALASRMSRKTVVYAAGSHTARLLPKLGDLGVLEHCVALADKNTNLHGGTFGGLPVLSPDELPNMQDCDILVSSFRFESEIAGAFKDMPNTVLTVYNHESTQG